MLVSVTLHVSFCDLTCYFLWPYMLLSVTLHVTFCDLTCYFLWPYMLLSVTLHVTFCDLTCYFLWPYMLLSVTLHVTFCDLTCYFLWPYMLLSVTLHSLQMSKKEDSFKADPRFVTHHCFNDSSFLKIPLESGQCGQSLNDDLLLWLTMKTLQEFHLGDI